MKLDVKEDPALVDVEVRIRCPRIDRRVRRIIEAAEIEDLRLAGQEGGFLRVVTADAVLYAETVDAKTFLYTADKVLETGLTLSELEAHLRGTEFVRATRQMLVNLAHVQGLRPYLNARLELALSNGERVVASRQFSPDIKKRIGL
ncbi:LytTR family DNA-binding domain-containing protein [Parvibacter caecicola]|uniref:LytTR family DNA-binding domain-containing protein n=1 Tax=Parvibacter caecicola TaxID=747645 RepID=UPI0023F1FDF4|nr:LytTR family DNA-binding domain-containing protein [Parvibacter caecicola]